MEQTVLETAAPLYELNEETQKEFISIIKRSMSGKQLDHREATMLFFWARHQNAPQFDFVPSKYRAVSPAKAPKKTAKKGK